MFEDKIKFATIIYKPKEYLKIQENSNMYNKTIWETIIE